jgi:hypothetical protein
MVVLQCVTGHTAAAAVQKVNGVGAKVLALGMEHQPEQ